MATPEGKVKAMIDRELKKRTLYYFNPQAGPFGKAGVPDKILCVAGHFIGIEVKSAKGRTSPLQDACMQKIEDQGGKCFVVRDRDTLDETLEYIDACIARPKGFGTNS